MDHSCRSLSLLTAFPLEEGSDFLHAAGSQEGGVQAHASKSSPDLSPTASLQLHPAGQLVPAPAPTQHSTSPVTPPFAGVMMLASTCCHLFNQARLPVRALAPNSGALMTELALSSFYSRHNK